MWFGDGESFILSTDTSVMKREIEKWEGNDGFQRYLDWMMEAHRHYELSVTEVLRKNFWSIFNMMRPSFLLNVFTRIHLKAFTLGHQSTSRLRGLGGFFTFGSMCMGMSPFDAPGTYSLLQYTELAEGIW